MEVKLKNDNESDLVFTFFWSNNIFIFYSFFLFFVCLY